MMKLSWILLLNLVCAYAVDVSAATLSQVTTLSLHDGINVVPGFLPDGSAATIIQAWRANGNAHSHHDWMVLSQRAEGHDAAEVTFADPDTQALEDIIGDTPFDGERVMRTLQFATGKVDGRSASLMLEASLDYTPSGIPADHAKATVRVFHLVATDGGPGDSPFEFKLLASSKTNKLYCSAELALAQAMDLPLPGNYGGPNQVDACIK